MSCWVVPSVAAEFWHVSLDHVMACIRDGSIPTRIENGFVFVDVLPTVTAPLPAPQSASPGAPPPPTFVLVQDDLETSTPTVDAADMPPSLSWTPARTRAASTRIPPRRAAA